MSSNNKSEGKKDMLISWTIAILKVIYQSRYLKVCCFHSFMFDVYLVSPLTYAEIKAMMFILNIDMLLD